jgi:hypothetical protein
LTALPTLCKHRALLPVVNVQCLIIEPRIILVAESACAFFLWWLLLLLLHILLSFHRGALHFRVGAIVVSSHCLLTVFLFFVILADLVRRFLFGWGL